MKIFHGSKVKVEKPEIRIGKFTKDFSYGFYCTIFEEQAKRWATKITGKGIVNIFDYKENPELKILLFPEMSEEWLDFIVSCRNGNHHEYDIVEGPMADDTIFNYIQSFLEGEISRSAFWELARFKKPTHQISFHTENALKTIQFMEAKEVVK